MFSIGQRAGDLPRRRPRDVPRVERRAELHCPHARGFHLLAVVTGDLIVTLTGETKYPDGIDAAVVTCDKCPMDRALWQLDTAKLRAAVEGPSHRRIRKINLRDIGRRRPL